MKLLVRALAFGLAGAGALATAFDQAAPPAPPAAPQTAVAPPPSAAPPLPPGPLEDFVPSEKVRADEAVAFPVDI